MSLEEIIKRTAARKASGVSQVYPQHAKNAAAAPARLPAKPLPLIGLACPDLGGRVAGGGCGSPLLHCTRFQDITTRFTKCKDAQRCCVDCPHNPVNNPAPTPASVTRIDPAKLAPLKDSRHFNCSLLDFQGKRLLAYRAGWAHSRVHVATLDENLQPTSTLPVELRHPRCAMAQEDPRLFAFDGAAHVIFAGVEWSRGKLTVSQMIARLAPDLTAERVWEPRYASRRFPMEKNWMPFEKDGGLFAVYSIRPHRVLRLDPLAGTATLAHEAPGPGAEIWPGWELRGGAPPVRVGDEFSSFFHGWKRSKRKGTPNGDWYEYAVGVYTFDAATFRPTRVCREPLWLADPAKRSLNVTRDKDVIYPSGAVLADNRWLVSAGHQDSECVIGEFSVADIGRALEPIA